jgi:hypothetical protein
MMPFYARSTPKLGAFPFFYWYQLILVPAVAIVSWLAYLCLRSGAAAKANAPRRSRSPRTMNEPREGLIIGRCASNAGRLLGS